MFLLLQYCISCVICGIFSFILISVKLCNFKTSYVIPRATKLVNESRLFSLQYRLSVSLMLPILITSILTCDIFSVKVMRRSSLIELCRVI